MSRHHLPEGILLDICLRLPLKSIARFRCVNKNFCFLLKSPNFIQKHLDHSIERDKFSLLICSNSDGKSSVHSMASRSDSSLSLSDYKTLEIDYPFKSQKPLVEIIGSCNGLVCLELNRRDVCIWNPSTTEFKKIQTLPDEFKWRPKSSPESRLGGEKAHSYGFGYDSKNGDYKLVRFELSEHVMYLSTCSIYTSGTNTWKNIPGIRYDVKPGVHLDGILYFSALRTRNHGDGWIVSPFILSFNVCDESVHEIELPDGLVGKVGLNVSVFGEKLCLICVIHGVHNELWLMKDFGENKGNWTKIVTIDDCLKGVSYLMPLHFFKTGEILFELQGEEVDVPNGVLLYDPKHKRNAALQMRGTHQLFGMQSYVPSLVSLKSGTFVGAGNSRNCKARRKAGKSRNYKARRKA
ncbi:F-box/kelch-repeat protein At3g06240-like isoform X2 [Papaver somniferum]|uniref:F-box/kelch-repeat protein At3g06240-like isoform X2 n=1 Tax=Papaver somniferum TaxID=3469 RepID=UPI000E6F6D71|nr:F-box/kelch-repeat protein At3g06240-like isoform X2 [Papaver somniferum]